MPHVLIPNGILANNAPSNTRQLRNHLEQRPTAFPIVLVIGSSVVG